MSGLPVFLACSMRARRACAFNSATRARFLAVIRAIRLFLSRRPCHRMWNPLAAHSPINRTATMIPERCEFLPLISVEQRPMSFPVGLVYLNRRSALLWRGCNRLCALWKAGPRISRLPGAVMCLWTRSVLDRHSVLSFKRQVGLAVLAAQAPRVLPVHRVRANTLLTQ
jgi:hypothetical protein